MSLQTRSGPSRCHSCGSQKIQNNSDYGENFIICHDCGDIFPGVEESSEEVSAILSKCAHCESVDAIYVYGDQEYCSICGLEPNRMDYAAEALAHLWKKRTPGTEKGFKLIQEAMIDDSGNRFSPDSNIGGFLRTQCGPHCVYEKDCPQTTKNLARCFVDERTIPDDIMSRRKGKNRTSHRSNKPHKNKSNKKNTYNKIHSRAWLFAPLGGWLVSVKQYETETIRKERSET